MQKIKISREMKNLLLWLAISALFIAWLVKEFR